MHRLLALAALLAMLAGCGCEVNNRQVKRCTEMCQPGYAWLYFPPFTSVYDCRCSNGTNITLPRDNP